MSEKTKTGRALIDIFSNHILTQNLYDLTVSGGRIKNRVFKIVKKLVKRIDEKNIPSRGKLLDKANKSIIDQENELKKSKYFYIEEREHESNIKKGNIAKSQASAFRLSQFINNIPEWKKNANKKRFFYLDIGAGEGTKTLDMRKKLGIKREDTYCLDLVDTSFIVNQERDACTYEFYDGKKMPFKDNQANLITIILAIHHVKNIDLFFKELSRITKKGGIIVVREHDVNDEILESMLRSLHFMHDVSNKVTGKDSKTYIESYYSMNQLIKLFEKYDFKLLANLDFRTKTGAYFIAFQKN